MNKEKWGVHRTHCCILHGCKYGDDDCPVEKGLIKQDYLCQLCTEPMYYSDRWTKERQWKIIDEEYKKRFNKLRLKKLKRITNENKSNI